MMPNNSTSQVKRKRGNPTGKGGFRDHPENINLGGEPKNSLKNYVARTLAALSDEEKDKWLKEHKISGIDIWKMGEGNPSSQIEAELKKYNFADEEIEAAKHYISERTK